MTGAIADKYGYKKVLFLAFAIYVSAFIMLPMFNTFTGVFCIYLYLALGAALFKPIISATVAKTTTDETSSIGFGIFYMMVNIGAFFGPLVTLLFKGANSHLIFYVSAAIISINFILLLFYKEPGREQEKNNTESIWQTFGGIFKNMISILKDVKFIVFLLIVAGFWTMYNQLFFTLPVFISQWVDTSSVYEFFSKYAPFFSNNYSTAPGVMDSEFITNFDALYIILLQVVVSSIVMKMKPLRSMMSGFLVCAIGMSLTLAFQNVIYTIIAIGVFAIGEMAGSPKITEYIGRIAPADKKALYMGYSFIPVFLGNVLAGIISGVVYQNMSDKVVMVKRFAAEKGLEISDSLSNNAYFDEVANKMNLSGQELTNLIWDTYHPSRMWMVLLAIGVGAALALFIYDKVTSKNDATHK
jgi:MFS family permease